jgi:raffinose/stachyose/melibiose transport system substrate-binding protein
MNKKGTVIFLVAFVLMGMLLTCNGFAAAKTKISLLNTKGEIQAQLEEAAKLFSKENPDIVLEVIPCPAGQNPLEKLSTLYAAGNAPTLAMIGPPEFPKFKGKLADLSKEKWVKDAIARTLDDSRFEGKIVAFPFAVEGYGFIYNKVVLDKAFDGKFDPAALKTVKSLEGAFKKVAASGVAPLIVSPLDWSLGNHYLGLAYADQSKDPKRVARFLQNLKAGKVDLAGNKVFNGLLNTFDIMLKYNQAKNDPMAVTYEKGPELLGKGEVGFWFMGNWAWPQIKSFDTANGGYGFLPVPLSDNAGDYGNTGIAVGTSKQIAMDKSQNSIKQQNAAKKFLNWLVYSKTGQDVLVNKANIIPAFKNITIIPNNPLAKSIRQYMAGGQTVQFMTTLPPDHWSQCGAYMQKYLAGKSDRKSLFKDIQAYWKNVK